MTKRGKKRYEATIDIDDDSSEEYDMVHKDEEQKIYEEEPKQTLFKSYYTTWNPDGEYTLLLQEWELGKQYVFEHNE